MNLAEGDPEGKARIATLHGALDKLGWAEGRNLQTEIRWNDGDSERFHRDAAELLATNPEVLLASASISTMALQRSSHAIPIVFVLVADPVGGGFVTSLARPGGNVTGFTQFEYNISGKWLELLKEIAPSVKRVVVLRNPAIAAGGGQLEALQTAAVSLGIAVRPVGVREPEIERAIAELGREPDGGVIVTGGGSASHRALIVGLAQRHRLPAAYPYRYFVADGGLIGYGPDPVDQYRQAAGYIDRILRGASPADLPVQAPHKYELVINLKTARTLGLTVPPTLLARADEVIE
jgi:putative ABC transport system substrate-binding protein